MRHLRLVLAITGAMAACATPELSPYGPRPVVAKCDPAETQSDYFGGQLMVVLGDRRASQEGTAILQGLGEVPLYCGRGGIDEEYRLLERPNMRDFTDVARVWRVGGRFWVSVASTSPEGGQLGRPGRFERSVTADEWAAVRTAIEPLQLWQPPPELPTPKKETFALYHGSG